MASVAKQIFAKFSNFRQLIPRNNLVPSVLCSTQRLYANSPTPYKIVDPDEEAKVTQDVIRKVNTQIAQSEQGRLFAVVHVAGKQFKITEGDVIVVEGYWPPDIGDRISLDKVLLVGGKDFSLIGRPLVQHGLVNAEATVIEKTVSHTKTHFRKKRRKQYKRIHFYRIPQTMLRINKVEVVGEVNNPPEVSGLEKIVL